MLKRTTGDIEISCPCNLVEFIREVSTGSEFDISELDSILVEHAHAKVGAASEEEPRRILTKISSAEILATIETKRTSRLKEFSIETLFQRIIDGNGWNPKDFIYLDQYSLIELQQFLEIS